MSDYSGTGGVKGSPNFGWLVRPAQSLYSLMYCSVLQLGLHAPTLFLDVLVTIIFLYKLGAKLKLRTQMGAKCLCNCTQTFYFASIISFDWTE